jgi:site-specific recombinase XerD
MVNKCEEYLKVTEWSSYYKSVNNLLKHLEHRKIGSEGSRGGYCFSLYSFCKYAGKLPDELVALEKADAEKLIEDYCYYKMENGWTSPRTANVNLFMLKAFFKRNGFRGNRSIEVDCFHQSARERIKPQYIPTLEEARGMAEVSGSLRNRAIILFLSSTGLRNSTLRAIRYKDIAAELAKDKSNLMIPIYPEMKEIEPNACKGGTPYYTFTCDEATQAITLYVKERLEKYGKIEDSEPLFCSEYNQIRKDERKKKTLTSREVQLIVKSAAKRAGISEWEAVHPHAIRKSYETVLHSQLIDGANLNVKVQEFFMGHTLPGSQDTYFDRSKTEHIRNQYSRLKFGRAAVENKFKVLKAAVARAFEDTGIDPEQVLEEYFKLKHSSNNPDPDDTSKTDPQKRGGN